MVLTYCGIVLVVLLFINYYPLVVARDLISSSAEDTMVANATVIANLSANHMDDLNAREDLFAQYASSSTYDRVLITDAGASILYDSRSDEGLIGSKAMLSEVLSALCGENSSFSDYRDDYFEFSAAVPIHTGQSISGCVYLYKMSKAEALLLATVRRQILLFSLVLCFVVLTLCLLFSFMFTAQIRALSGGVEQMREGNYGVSVPVETQDELGLLAETFNDLNRKLQLTDQKRKEFVSNASHELKTPLASIRLLVDSLQQTPDLDPNQLREFLGDIDHEIERLIRITERLFVLTRIDSGVTVPAVLINMADEVRAAIRVHEPLAASRGIAIEAQLQEDCLLRGSKDSFSQIAHNLIDNAVKYNNDGGIVQVRLFRERDQIVFSVADNGVGIPAEEQQKVFERFYRVDKARSRETGGTGLGLAIVRSNCEQLGGHITLHSIVGQGTEFELRFPAAKEG